MGDMVVLHRSHPDTAAQPAPQAAAPTPARTGHNWKKILILSGTALVLLVAGYFILGAFIPRWWAQRIGKTVAGSFTTGTLLGLCIAFTATLVPLFVFTLALRPRARWKMRIVWFVLALILAVPNLCTLTVVAGGGSGAHAAQRIMDVDAPAFRGASLVGVLLAALVYLVVMFFVLRRRFGKRGKGQGAEPGPRTA
jgi:hypothetical protein